MRDIVIPLGKGSRWNDNEIRYALRAVAHFMPKARVFIIGHKPKWLHGVEHIPFVEDPAYEAKERNIMRKVLAACDHPDISDDFFFMNDDLFLLKKPPVDYPFYYDKPLERKVETRRSQDHYLWAQRNTCEILKKEGLPTLNYDVHFPIVYNKEKFKQVMAMYDWSIQHGYVVKSLYCNTLEVEGTRIKDCKLFTRKLKDDLRRWAKGKTVFSIGDGAINGQLELFLKELYPRPSKFEVAPKPVEV